MCPVLGVHSTTLNIQLVYGYGSKNVSRNTSPNHPVLNQSQEYQRLEKALIEYFNSVINQEGVREILCDLEVEVSGESEISPKDLKRFEGLIAEDLENS